ncbi:unnamed protein product [Closterium sp. NIES-53]
MRSRNLPTLQVDDVPTLQQGGCTALHPQDSSAPASQVLAVDWRAVPCHLHSIDAHVPTTAPDPPTSTSGYHLRGQLLQNHLGDCRARPHNIVAWVGVTKSTPCQADLLKSAPSQAGAHCCRSAAPFAHPTKKSALPKRGRGQHTTPVDCGWDAFGNFGGNMDGAD